MDKTKIVNKYSSGEITIVWQPGKCIYAGNCVRGLSEVFNARVKPWIQVEGADKKSIIDQVKNCPSGALSILENEIAPPSASNT
jgi:uncharacterized Fe-S cluster protein YjdI